MARSYENRDESSIKEWNLGEVYLTSREETSRVSIDFHH